MSTNEYRFPQSPEISTRFSRDEGTGDMSHLNWVLRTKLESSVGVVLLTDESSLQSQLQVCYIYIERSSGETMGH